MPSIFALARHVTTRSAWLALLPTLIVCSGDKSTGTTETPPGTVSDLSVSAIANTSVTLTFTQVDDGTGQAANYDVRYAVAPMSWGSASSTASGTCATPVAGTGVGSSLTCSILGLSPSTNYNFQLIAFRGTLTADAVFGDASNVASAATTNAPPPPPVVTTVTVTPPSASIAVGATVVLQATAKDAQGNVMSGQTVVWSTSNAAAATVSASGVVTGVGAGSATITATCAGKLGTSSVTVTSAPPPPPPVVTTVTVAPSTASIVVGATVALSATVKDAQGNVMTGQTIVWSTSNAAAATVSASGVVTGVAAGSATITATCSGKTGSSAMAVTAPPPPPPGGTVLFQEDFEDANLASRGWYDNTGAVLSTTEHIAGSNSSAQYRFLVGATVPTAGSSQRHKFTPSNSFYMSFYVKYSANWVGSQKLYHPHEFYVMSTLDGDWDGPSNAYMTLYVEHNYQNGGIPWMSIQDNKSINTTYGTPPQNLVGVTENRSTTGCNGVAESNINSECFNAPPWYNRKWLAGPVVFKPTAGPGYKNDWNFVEAYFQLNTIVNGVGQADGVMQYWFNGTLIIDRHDILFRTGAHPTLQFNQFLIAPYIGDGSPVDQSMFIDNLRIATSRIP